MSIAIGLLIPLLGTMIGASFVSLGIAIQNIPEASSGEHSNLSTIGFTIGFVLMMVLDVVMG